MGHVRMMAAAQPFLSGAISKTVNLPEDATVEEIEDVYLQGWKLGLKALAVYRDNCKVGQPLSDAKAKPQQSAETVAAVEAAVQAASEVHRPTRKRLPKRRPSQTTSFAVGGAEGYLTAGSYPDDGLGEIFLKFGKQGSTLAGVMDAFSVAISVALQYGVPLETFVEKFTNMRFEPAGMTDDPDVRMAQSLMDYVFRRLALDHLDFETRSYLGIHTAEERARQLETGSYTPADSEAESDEAEIAGYASTAVLTSGAKKTEASDEREFVAPADDHAGHSGHEGHDHTAAETVAAQEIISGAGAASAKAVSSSVHSSAELMEKLTGKASDAPMCMTCGVKMRAAGSCYVCEGCGSTSGCS
jgi:ribonucleoside-diphosphate reductase alpha chain